MKDRMKMMTAFLAVMLLGMSTALVVMQTDNVSAEDTSWFEDSLISDSKAPRTEEEFIHQWTTSARILENKTISGWNHIPGVPVIVDDYVYIRINGIIYKLDIYTGEDIASVPSYFGNNMFGHWIGYAECNGGMILDPLNKRAFDMDLNPLYDFERTHVKFFHYGDKIYGIDSAGVSVYEPGSGTASMRITYTGSGTNQSPVFVGDYMYTINTSGGRNISSYSLTTGEFVDSCPVGTGSIYSDPTYHNGYVYLTTYGSDPGCLVYRLPVSNGDIDSDNAKYVKLHDKQVIIDGTGYTTTTSSLIPYDVDGKNLGFVKTNIGLYVIDLDSADLDIITSADTAGKWYGNGRGGISMTDGYFADSGKLYFYAIPYQATREVIVYTYTYDSMAADDAKHTVSYASYVFPEISNQFNTENVFFGKDGQIIWHNDSGNLFCFAPFHNVRFVTGSGTSIGTAIVTPGEKVVRPADPVWNGKTFGGWYADPELTVAYDFNSAVNENLALYAKWDVDGSVVTHKVNFNTKGGSAVISQSVIDGSFVQPPADPARYGYTFAGWYADPSYNHEYDFNASVTSNVTLYAKWTESSLREYAVKVYQASGNVLYTAYVTEGTSFQKPTDVPIREGYKFAGWGVSSSSTSAEFDFNAPITSDTSIYAKWTKLISCTVTFDSNGGSKVMSQTMYEGELVFMPTEPAKRGYEFAGWYSQSDLTGNVYNFNKPVSGDFTLYAKWDALPSYNVSFECNGGSGTSSKTVYENECCSRPADPVKEGHTFAGWYTDAELTTQHDFDDTVSGNTTLYAKWVASNANVGGGDGNDNTVYYAVAGVAAVAVIIGLVYFLVIRKP